MGFNALMNQYGPQGLVIVGFPCAQFLNQEPGTNAEIPKCLSDVRPGGGFKPNFPLVGKVEVNGAGSHPMFLWLRSICPQTAEVIMSTPMLILWEPVTPSDITWNFEKFLFNRRGVAYRRYKNDILPPAMIPDIEYLLSQ